MKLHMVNISLRTGSTVHCGLIQKQPHNLSVAYTTYKNLYENLPSGPTGFPLGATALKQLYMAVLGSYDSRKRAAHLKNVFTFSAMAAGVWVSRHVTSRRRNMSTGPHRATLRSRPYTPSSCAGPTAATVSSLVGGASRSSPAPPARGLCRRRPGGEGGRRSRLSLPTRLKSE